MINTFDKKDFGWGSKILTPGPSILTNGPILDLSDVLKHIHELNHDCMLTCHQTLIIAFISFPWGMHRQMPHELLQQLFFQRCPGKKITNNAMNIPTELHPCPLDMCLQKDTGISTWFFLEYPVNAHFRCGILCWPLLISRTNQGTCF